MVTELVQAGIGHLKQWLQEHGYTDIKTNVWQPDSADIMAKGPKDEILVQVKAVAAPGQQDQLNATDKFALIEMAARLERIPYIAYIVVDDNKNLVGEIVWERLI